MHDGISALWKSMNAPIHQMVSNAPIVSNVPMLLFHNFFICRRVPTSGEHLFQMYRRLIGRPYIALARQDKIYRNISVHWEGPEDMNI